MNISSKYSPGYVDQVFATWYDAGKPSQKRLWDLIPDSEHTDDRPSIVNLSAWINHDAWIARTEELDAEINQHFKEAQIKSKVEMFERHAKIGKDMQDISMTWLKDHASELTPGTAVRMLVDGVTIEQGTAGIPDALKKMITMNDADLQDEIAQLLADSPSYNADT